MIPEIPQRVKGMKFLHFGENYHSIAVETPPMKRSILTLQCDTHEDDDAYRITEKPYFLLFPYIIYFIRFNYHYLGNSLPYKFRELRIGLSDKPITSAKNMVIRPCFSNIYSMTNQVCTEKFKDVCAPTLQNMVDNIIGYFWQSSFKSIGFLQPWLELTNNNGPLSEVLKFTNHAPISIFEMEPNFKAQDVLSEE